MATIERRTAKDGTVSWRARVRKGEFNLSETFPRKREAQAWATQIETEIRERRLYGRAARHSLRSS